MSQKVQAFVTTHQIVVAAREKASQDTWNYITGAVRTC